VLAYADNLDWQCVKGRVGPGIAFDYGDEASTILKMHSWSLTLHGPGGILSRFDSPEAQFVLGTESAPDVLTVAGEGVAPRHAWVWLADSAMQVEDLAGGTLVNGHPVTARVEVEYPASVQVGDVTLVVEVKSAAVDRSTHATIPHRTPARGGTVARDEAAGAGSSRANSGLRPTSIRWSPSAGAGQRSFANG
jgi:hypothetical protein